MEYYVSDIKQFNRGHNLCLSMNVQVPYEERYIPFYLECRIQQGEDGKYYAIPEEKTLAYVSDEHIRNNVRETARSQGTLYLNTDRGDVVF